MKLDLFINRPVLSTVISIFIVILGTMGLMQIPITQYPDIAPPTVQVWTSYMGANAQTVLNSVIAPLEEQINGVENMDYMSSSATNTGQASIQITFKMGTDPDMAAINVQNRVAKATGLLPAEVTQVGVITQKRQSSMLMVFSLVDTEDRYTSDFLESYVKINLIPQVQRVSGVGDAYREFWQNKTSKLPLVISVNAKTKLSSTPSAIEVAFRKSLNLKTSSSNPIPMATSSA